MIHDFPVRHFELRNTHKIACDQRHFCSTTFLTSQHIQQRTSLSLPMAEPFRLMLRSGVATSDVEPGDDDNTASAAANDGSPLNVSFSGKCFLGKTILFQIRTNYNQCNLHNCEENPPLKTCSNCFSSQMTLTATRSITNRTSTNNRQQRHPSLQLARGCVRDGARGLARLPDLLTRRHTRTATPLGMSPKRRSTHGCSARRTTSGA